MAYIKKKRQPKIKTISKERIKIPFKYPGRGMCFKKCANRDKKCDECVGFSAYIPIEVTK